MKKVVSRKVINIAASVALTSGAVLGGTAGTASAATTALPSCPSSAICLYYNSYFGGGIKYFYGGIKQYYNFTFTGEGGDINNNVASVKNRDSVNHVMEYQYYDYTGWGFKVWKYGSVDSWGGREGYSDWSTLPDTRKNAFSSHEFY
ncbi:peptidase inhibitor family I36 protein [Streptomyces exfoliatus]|uniref:peptidase inhibitor family I36 protein n=1 Tax=Streptomyces exfoliatus TaxID=1905 RepID=UPI003C2F648B